MAESNELSKELLEIICCPMDKADLVYDKNKSTLTCKKCRYKYPIREGIPILLPPEMIEAEKAKK
ncbi:MAG: Trm112 family protein [archaeon]